MDGSMRENIEQMEVGVDQEAGFIQGTRGLNESGDSFGMSFGTFPVFGTNISDPLQQSQGFSFKETLPYSSSVNHTMTATADAGQHDDNTIDVKPVLTGTKAQLTKTYGDDPSCHGELPIVSANSESPNLAVFNTGSLLMSLSNSQAGGVSLAQPTDLIKCERVFMFGGQQDTAGPDVRTSAGLSDRPVDMNLCTGTQEPVRDSAGTHSNSKTAPKVKQSKNRPRNFNNANTEPQQSSSPTHFDASDSMGSMELGFKPSLLNEILTEKKLALMRSPEVVSFLQAQQKKISHGQYTES